MPLTLSRPLVFFDLETTGVNVFSDRIIEISLLKLFPDFNEEINTFRINPGIPIPKDATAIHGITNQDVKDEPTLAQLAPKILQILKECDLCGYNILKFDLPLLQIEFQRHKIPFSITGVRIVDPMNIFLKKEPRNLTAALKFYCNKELINAHSAEADTIATKEILLAQIEKYDDVPSDIQALSELSIGNTRKFADLTGKLIYNQNNEILFNFGKHKNQRVIDNREYAQWILSTDFPEDTKKIIMSIINEK